ncbi:retrovirus-related pol polyprotein from transposon TNT 1-94 [Tanacetum coccineum]
MSETIPPIPPPFGASSGNPVISFMITSESAPMITSDSEDDSDIQEPLPLLPKLTGVNPSGASKRSISLSDLTANMADLTLNTASKEIKKSSNKVSQTYVIKKRTESKHPAVQSSCPDKNALPSTEQLLLTLMEEVKGIKNQILIPSDTSSSVSQACSSKTPKQKVWYGPCKHCGMRNHLSDDCYSKPKCSTCGSISHTTKEHTEQTAVRKSLNKLKGQSTSKSTPVRTTRMSKTFGECKYYGSNKHHPDDCEFYPGCEICGSIAHEIADCLKNLRNSRKQRVDIKQSEPTEKWEPDPKVVFGDDSLGDTKGYGLVNCNGITFTRVAYVNGLKHNLISISQLCDANFKLLFTKTRGTIFNQNDEVVLIAPRRRDVYIIDMSSFNKESNACFLAKASPRAPLHQAPSQVVLKLPSKRPGLDPVSTVGLGIISLIIATQSLSALLVEDLMGTGTKTLRNMLLYYLKKVVMVLNGFWSDSLETKDGYACKKGKHHRASFKTKRSFSINKSLHLLHMDLFGPVKPQTISTTRLIIVDEYSRKMESLNEVRVKEVRSDNGIEFRNYKLEELCDEKGISQNFLFRCT